MKNLFTYLLIIMFAHVGFGQTDTIVINASRLSISNLKEGTSQYLVYFKKGEKSPASNMQLCNIEIRKEVFEGERVLTIYQKWDFQDTIAHTAKSVSKLGDFKPLYHESWWKVRGKQTFDVINQKLFFDDVEVTSSESESKRKSVLHSFSSSENQYFLNWHLDLEVFSMLPYRKNAVFLIPFYEFGYDIPRNIAYSVVDESSLVFGGKTIKCWILRHKDEGNEELYWISKKTHEVLKMEQKFGETYRYKLKLASVL